MQQRVRAPDGCDAREISPPLELLEKTVAEMRHSPRTGHVDDLQFSVLSAAVNMYDRRVWEGNEMPKKKLANLGENHEEFRRTPLRWWYLRQARIINVTHRGRPSSTCIDESLICVSLVV